MANKPLRTPASRFVRAIPVLQGFDAAGQRIAGEMQSGDLIVPAGVPAGGAAARAL